MKSYFQGKLLISGQIFSTPPVKCLPVRLWVSLTHVGLEKNITASGVTKGSSGDIFPRAQRFGGA